MVEKQGKSHREPVNSPRPVERVRLPDERNAITHKFSVGGHEGYLTVGLYDDGVPGEIFIVMAKEGSTLSGLMDGIAKVVSTGLQHGVPLKATVKQLRHMKFEPSGFTKNPDIPLTHSILDYIARWLGFRFLPEEDRREMALTVGKEEAMSHGVLSEPTDANPS